jgi:hypothetical protein
MYKEINMFQSIKKFFGFGDSAVPEVQNQSAPYKVPEPAATTPIPLVVEVAPVVETAAAVATEVPAVATKPKAPAKRGPAKPKAPAKAVKKPVAKRAPKAPSA